MELHPLAIFVFSLALVESQTGRYSPPSDPRAYDFPFIKHVPTVNELISNAGFNYDLHKVVTEDGHILSLHRLGRPGERRGVPVLFVNGFCFQSEGWMGLGRNTSIAFILSDLGYDVWLGDQRGTGRSTGHVKYSLDDYRTYQYSFHEMGVYDLPAFIDHILEATGHERLLYVGLSLGSGVFAVMETELPAYRDKVIAAVFLGPAIHLTNWIKTSFFYYNILRIVDSMIESQIQRKLWVLFANKPLIRTTLHSCSFVPLNIYLSSCLTLVGLTLGPYTGNMNATTSGVQLASVITSTSVYVAKHLFQVLKKGEFTKYDYGNKEKNMQVYGTPTAPNYDLSKVTTPLLVMYGSVDNMASFKVSRTGLKTWSSFAPVVITSKSADPIGWLRKEIPSWSKELSHYRDNKWLFGGSWKIGCLAVERTIDDMVSSTVESQLLPDFNHVDYLYGRQAPKRVYVPLVDFFDRMTSQGGPDLYKPSKSKVKKVGKVGRSQA